MEPIVVGISGASGVVLGVKLVRALVQAEIPVELVVTESGYTTLKEEMGFQDGFKGVFSETERKLIHLNDNKNLAASIASGSYRVRATVIVPCSMTTLAAVATGFGDTLLRRAAQVALKEGRPLLIVPRETPMSEIHLMHLGALAHMGTKVVFPVPGWYAKPKTIEDVESFIVGKILDVLHVPNDLYTRWIKTQVAPYTA